MKKLTVSLLLATTLTGCWVGLSQLWRPFYEQANTPYPRNHANPQSNDYIPLQAPTEVRRLWQTLGHYSFFNACTSGPEGNIYCSSFKDPDAGDCNFLAIDYRTGDVLWTDADSNGGDCLLDEFTFVNSPLIDRDGNVYTSDSQRVISYTSDGVERWQNDLPAQLTILGGNGRVNNPFGFSYLTTGEIVSVSLGDAFAIVMDPATGTLLSDPFDIPAVKLVSPTPFVRPAGHLEKFGGMTGADAVWNSSFADLGNQNDNDISIDGHTNTIFMVSAAEGPNNECEEPVDNPATPCGDGKLWALQYDPGAPSTQKIKIVFTVRFEGPGGSATTPAVSKDGRFVLFADGSSGLRAVHLPNCLADFAGVAATAANNYNECDNFSIHPLPQDLLASPTFTEDNVAMTLGGTAGVVAVKVQDSISGTINFTPQWIHGDDLDSNGNPVDELPIDCGPGGCVPGAFGTFTNPSSVITAFENITYFTYTTLQITGFNPEIPVQRFSIDAEVTPGLIGIDTQTGDEVFRATFADGVGDTSNVTMAADRKTLLTNNFNFVTQIARDRKRPLIEQRDAGLSAWVPVRTEVPVRSQMLDFSGSAVDFKIFDNAISTGALGRSEDPQISGAELTVFNPDTGEKEIILLPKENWSFRMDETGFFELGGYEYLDGDQSEGPCTVISLRDWALTGSCSGLAFTLDEATQGRLGVAFSVSPSRHDCGLWYGASITQDEPGEFHAGINMPSQDCVIP